MTLLKRLSIDQDKKIVDMLMNENQEQEVVLEYRLNFEHPLSQVTELGTYVCLLVFITLEPLLHVK